MAELSSSNTPLDSITGYAIWRNKISEQVLSASHKQKWNPIIARCFIDRLYKEATIYVLNGEATVYQYYWGNGEPLILVAWGDHFFRENLFWLSAYPFLESISTNKRLFRLSSEQQIFQAAKSKHKAIIASYNNHFGHFCFDNMPILRMVGLTHKKTDEIVLLPEGLRKDICSASEVQLRNYSVVNNFAISSKMPQSGLLCRTQFKSLTEIFTSNLMSNAFLLRNSYRLVLDCKKSEQALICNASPERLFFCRKGDFASRIYNQREILRLLTWKGFAIIDPSEYSPTQLSRLLRSARLIVSEAGTATLLANIFSSTQTKVITLLPERLFLQPDPEMIESGLPYILCFMNKTEICTGSSVKKHRIQTSDIVQYDSIKLERIIDCHP